MKGEGGAGEEGRREGREGEGMEGRRGGGGSRIIPLEGSEGKRQSQINADTMLIAMDGRSFHTGGAVRPQRNGSQRPSPKQKLMI